MNLASMMRNMYTTNVAVVLFIKIHKENKNTFFILNGFIRSCV